jgi:Leucine-rich repeat (LRR) protein
MVHLKGLTSLRVLALTGTQVTETGVNELKKALPNCQVSRGLLKLGSEEPGPELGRDEVIAAIKKLGGIIRYDEKSPERPILVVDFSRTEVTDADLVHLKRLTSLRVVDLSGTRVTDAGLEHLKGLTRLFSLSLVGTQVTDPGLQYLKGLTSLRDLALDRTHVTDAGLEHLKTLTNLQGLGLGDTRVTDAGVNELKKTLPKCLITH